MNPLRLLRLPLLNFNQTRLTNRGHEITRYLSSVKSKESDTIIDEPIKYSRSAAHQYKAKTTRTGFSNSRLWYEPYVIMASITVFLIYFTVLREENDVDEELSRSLYSRISGLEQHQLKLSLKYNQEHGLETGAIISRLKELEDENKNVAPITE